MQETSRRINKLFKKELYNIEYYLRRAKENKEKGNYHVSNYYINIILGVFEVLNEIMLSFPNMIEDQYLFKFKKLEIERKTML